MSPQNPILILQKPLDFDSGLSYMNLMITASDRGKPPRQANTTLVVYVKDIDDMPPIFTRAVYKTKVKESFPVTGKPVHVPLYFEPPILAFDQDSLNASITYHIVSGNERKLFWMSAESGLLFLQKEIDLEAENLPDNMYVLQIEAKQANNPQKNAFAR